jgi:hypothetical protein
MREMVIHEGTLAVEAIVLDWPRRTRNGVTPGVFGGSEAYGI